jgi:4-amino-4-deoxy-L-arabinose transferase-like glycosyltransferase
LSYNKKLTWLITITTIARVVIASTQEFGNVEAYYWVLSTRLQTNYFDHPPMVAWLIRLTTANLLIHNELFVRLGAIIAAAICTWLVYKIGSLLAGEKAGWYTAILYSTSVYSGINIAAFILPDSPQIVFWLASLYVLLKILPLKPTDLQFTRYWCIFGLLSGLCIMSKVHGVFLWVGALSYLLIYDRRAFRSSAIYYAMGITLLLVMPILLWNLQNDFVTYKFHSSRISLSGSGINLLRFIKQSFQMIFSTGPVHIFLIGMAIYHIIRGKLPFDKNSVRLLLLCSLPLIAILGVISVFREVLPHWPGPALTTLFILPGAYLATAKAGSTTKLPWALKAAIVYVCVIAAVEVVIVRYTPGTISPENDGMKTGANDPTIDMYGWDVAATKFDSLYRDDIAKKIMPANCPIVVTSYIPGAHIDYYIASRTGQQIWGLGAVYDLHQYYWLNKTKRPLLKGDNAYYIVPSNIFTYKSVANIINKFQDYDFALSFPVYRTGLICKKYYIIRLRSYKGRPF